jgi:hypothetical protein
MEARPVEKLALSLLLASTLGAFFVGGTRADLPARQRTDLIFEPVVVPTPYWTDNPEDPRITIAVATPTPKPPRPTASPTPRPTIRPTPHPQSTAHLPIREFPADVMEAREYALSRIGATQFACLDILFDRESRWRDNAMNKRSGAYGIPQALPGDKMAHAGADWKTNPVTQVRWGLGYISGRYGSACAALQHSYSVGWY